MSCLDDSDNHLRWLAPTDLNLDYMGITHLDCVTRVRMKFSVSIALFTWDAWSCIFQFYKKHWPDLGLLQCFLWIKGTGLSLVLLQCFFFCG